MKRGTRRNYFQIFGNVYAATRGKRVLVSPSCRKSSCLPDLYGTRYRSAAYNKQSRQYMRDRDSMTIQWKRGVTCSFSLSIDLEVASVCPLARTRREHNDIKAYISADMLGHYSHYLPSGRDRAATDQVESLFFRGCSRRGKCGRRRKTI